jgi:hypothetical protein
MARKKGVCRDCRRCGETGATKLVKAPVRLVTLPVRLPWLALARQCPICGHPYAWHDKDATGRLSD